MTVVNNSTNLNYRRSINMSNINCNSNVSFPAGVDTPTYWYDASLDVATSNQTDKNTVVSGEVRNMFDKGTSGLRLNEKASFQDWWLYDSNWVKNNLTFHRTGANYRGIFRNDFTTFNATAGQGTLVLVSYNNNHSFGFEPADSQKIGRTQWFGFNSGPTRGWALLKKQTETSTKAVIIGDDKAYEWPSLAAQWVVTIVSVPSIGSTNYAKQNGVDATVISYDQLVGGTGVNRIVIESQNDSNFAEAMFFQSALSTADCISVENYLKTKWCISY